MKMLKTIPLYTFLLSLFFCLHIAQESFGYVPLSEAIEFWLLAMLCISLLFGITLLVTRSLLYAGFVSFLVSTCYLYFGALKSGLASFPFMGKYTFLLPALAIFIILVLIIAKGKQSFLRNVTLFLNLLLIIYCLVDIGIIIQKTYAKKEQVFLNEIEPNLALVKAKPNVFFLLFDEYAGYESLQQKFNFKNDILYEQLVRDSFAIIPVFANYSITAFGMSSIFNMDYISSLSTGDTVGWHQTKQRTNEIRNAKIFGIFRDMGYEVNNYSLFQVGEQKSSGANKYFQGYKGLLTFNVFHNVLIRDLGWHFSTGENARQWMQEILMEDLPVYNEKIEAKLIKSIRKSPKPQFTYAHFLMPHPPFLFDSNGTRKPIAQHFQKGAWTDKEQYISYLKYCNKKMLDYERSISQADPGAVIILMSDHGVRFDTATLGSSALNNFCAMRLPSTRPDSLSRKMSNANIFRYLLNNAFNQNLPYLEDSMIFLNEVDRPN